MVIVGHRGNFVGGIIVVREGDTDVNVVGGEREDDMGIRVIIDRDFDLSDGVTDTHEGITHVGFNGDDYGSDSYVGVIIGTTGDLSDHVDVPEGDSVVSVTRVETKMF